MPFFKNCIGALDGSHIPCKVAACDAKPYDESTHVIRDEWSASYIDIIGFIEDHGHFALVAIDSLDESTRLALLRNVSFLIFDIVNGLMDCVAMRNEFNSSSDIDTPPVYPFQLVKLKGRDIGHLVMQQKTRLDWTWSPSDIDKIGSEFAQLCAMYKNDPAFQEAIDSCNHQCSFDDAWALPCLSGRFTLLVDFVGGLVSPFSNTAPVESDFSNLKYRKDVFNMSLTDFGLERFLQCKQYDLLRMIKQ